MKPHYLKSAVICPPDRQSCLARGSYLPENEKGEVRPFKVLLDRPDGKIEHNIGL